ncbi:hypothetical protein BZG36_03137 [Bifiguratus adelaidae]|uniref:Uncharacterized protein n=1 Tax=Bifiguratus adelaidae TaxID=1938954 RepID=A0A261XX93_9FUNG|nr:hypothetical protein BZG36_03137 [Bifiguratus adelaidae]
MFAAFHRFDGEHARLLTPTDDTTVGVVFGNGNAVIENITTNTKLRVEDQPDEVILLRPDETPELQRVVVCFYYRQSHTKNPSFDVKAYGLNQSTESTLGSSSARQLPIFLQVGDEIGVTGYRSNSRHRLTASVRANVRTVWGNYKHVAMGLDDGTLMIWTVKSHWDSSLHFEWHHSIIVPDEAQLLSTHVSRTYISLLLQQASTSSEAPLRILSARLFHLASAKICTCFRDKGILTSVNGATSPPYFQSSQSKPQTSKSISEIGTWCSGDCLRLWMSYRVPTQTLSSLKVTASYVKPYILGVIHDRTLRLLYPRSINAYEQDHNLLPNKKCAILDLSRLFSLENHRIREIDDDDLITFSASTDFKQSVDKDDKAISIALWRMSHQHPSSTVFLVNVREPVHWLMSQEMEDNESITQERTFSPKIEQTVFTPSPVVDVQLMWHSTMLMITNQGEILAYAGLNKA